MVNALACNGRGDRLVPQLQRRFRAEFLVSIQSPAQSDLKWSVWHCSSCDVRGLYKQLSPEARYTNAINYSKYCSFESIGFSIQRPIMY